MIVAEKLSKYFNDFLAVDDINLQVNEGEVLALLGPNGAGKTTTVRMLTSILKPSEGRATIAGYDVVTQAQQVRALVGVLTESGAVDLDVEGGAEACFGQLGGDGPKMGRDGVVVGEGDGALLSSRPAEGALLGGGRSASEKACGEYCDR